MKTFKPTVLLCFIFCIAANLLYSQQMYQVHVDFVKPSKIMEYESIAKDFLNACKEHNPQASWIVARTSDDRYMYISSAENYAEFDKNPFADMAKAMGDDFGNLFKRFDQCYDSHGDFTIYINEDLSYMPEGISQTQEGENFRKYFFLYHYPRNDAKLREAMKEVKEFFVSKDSKMYYRVYHSGFGITEHYFLVAISAKDELDYASKDKANNELFGEEAQAVFLKVMENTARFEELSGMMRPDLYYKQKE